MDAYIEGTTSKKKFLIPLVALLFCGVALTGAAYAYQSTVDGSGSISDVDYVTIDFTGSNYNSATMNYAAEKALTYNSATKLIEGEKTTVYTADETVVLMKVVVDVNSVAVEIEDNLAAEPTLTIDGYKALKDAGITLEHKLVKSENGVFEYEIYASGEIVGEAPAKDAVAFNVHAEIATA